MDYQKELKEWYEHYETRYKKAVSLHIDEGSRHYQAFKEIEKRYSALYITLHFYREIPRILAGEEAEKLIKSYIIVILKTLFFGEVIKNEDGKTECIHPWLKINKSDAEKVEAYEDAILARKHLSVIDFERTDTEQFADEIREDLFHVVNWYLIAREMVYPVTK